MKKAIIIFVRHPEKGKVKTRLAAEIGDEAALKVYIQLLQHTREVSLAVSCDRFVFYTDKIIPVDDWDTGQYFKRVQSGHDLGQRMQLAFRELFDTGYHRVIIIGSDCPGLSTALIEKGFDLLDSSDAVLGPAKDGGYYLLGLNGMITPLFQNINWSTGSVLAQSLSGLTHNGFTFSLLPMLQDIDTKEDLVQLNYKVPG